MSESKKLKSAHESRMQWARDILEIRTQNEAGEIDKKMIDTSNHRPRGVTFTPGKI